MKIIYSIYSCLVLLLFAGCSVHSPMNGGWVPLTLPEDFCYLDAVAPEVRVDLKYNGYDNFVGRPIAGYSGTRAILRKDTAAAIKRASDLLAKEGLGLLVWDAYRPTCAMVDFRRWSRTDDERMKARFYPNISKQGIYDGKYIGDISEHSWGVAVDVTLVDLQTGLELDMGGHHDFLDVTSYTSSSRITPTQLANRLKLRKVMTAVGMRNYSREWWHYFLAERGTVFTYNFEVRDDLKPAP